MSELTPERLADLRARADKTLTGLANGGYVILEEFTFEEMAFVLAALDAANARVAELERLLEKAETRTTEIEQWTEKDELVAALYRARKSADCAEDFNDKLLSALCGVVNQACQVEMDGEDPIVDDSGLSAYEDAFALLEELGYLEQLRRGYRLTWPPEEASDQ